MQQGERLIEGSGLELGSLAEPGRIEAIILTTGTAMVIHVFGDRIDQSPGGIAGTGEIRAHARALIEFVELLDGSGKDDLVIGVQRLGQQIAEEAQRLFRSDRTLDQGFGLRLELVPVGKP